MTPLVRRLSLWGPVIAQMAAIFFLSSLHDPAPLMPDGLTDKGGHFIGYALLGALVLRALAGGRLRAITWRLALAALALSALYAASDEVHQMFVAGRSPDVLDWAADSAGALGAVCCGRLAAALSR